MMRNHTSHQQANRNVEALNEANALNVEALYIESKDIKYNNERKPRERYNIERLQSVVFVCRSV